MIKKEIYIIQTKEDHIDEAFYIRIMKLYDASNKIDLTRRRCYEYCVMVSLADSGGTILMLFDYRQKAYHHYTNKYHGTFNNIEYDKMEELEEGIIDHIIREEYKDVVIVECYDESIIINNDKQISYESYKAQLDILYGSMARGVLSKVKNI